MQAASSEHEITLARRIHRSLLPADHDDERVRWAVRCHEHTSLGGDYCTARYIGNDRLFLSVCDVTGHGLPAALLAGRINSFVHHAIETAAHPREVVQHLNRFLFRNFSTLGVFATFYCVLIDFQTGRLDYAGAGHPPCLLKRKKAPGVNRLPSESPMLGVLDEVDFSCAACSIPVVSGDRLLIYTDGLTEARDADGNFFDLSGAESSLNEWKEGLSPQVFVDALIGRLVEFADTESFDDDVLLLALSIK
ncbi:MAG: hypothetical protein Fur0032_15820 [Terrimicrobiaceae bacterium]